MGRHSPSSAALTVDRSRPRAPVRVPIPRLKEGDHALGPRVAHYLDHVHRLHAGDRFAAFDPDRGLEADALVLEVSEKDLVARVGPLRAAAIVATREVTWIQALPKGEKMDSIVRDATELGATRIVPATSSFTVVKLEGPRREARRQRWERIAQEAARQCGRSDVPSISPVLPWSDALGAGEAGRAGFCLYEKATAPIGPALALACGSVGALAFAAGPEGGLSPEEVLQASERGFDIVSLGRFILRAETVAAATLGALRAFEQN